MAEKWELCIARDDGSQVYFYFYGPNGYRRSDAEGVIFGDEWHKLDKQQRRALLEKLSYGGTKFDAATCRLLADGWVPIGIGMATESSSTCGFIAFRRPYSESV